MEGATEGGSKEANPVEASADQDPEWMDKDFFQRTLKSGPNEPELKIKSCQVAPAVALGDNYASVIYRAKLVTGEGEIRSVIVKSLPSNQFRQMMAEQLGTFKKEIMMYQNVLTRYTKFFKERIDPEVSPPWPKCLYSHKDGVRDTIILEDLKPQGYVMADRRVGLTEEQLRLALSSLGLFHALSIAYKIEDPKNFQVDVVENCGNIPESSIQMMKPMLAACMTVVEELVRGWGHEKEADKIVRMKETCLDDLLEAQQTMDKNTSVLNHGDFWINNFLFREGTDGVPLELKMLDFQLPRYGSPVMDLIYLVVSSTTLEIRKKHWLRLLEEAYLSTLYDTLEKLGHCEFLRDGKFSMEWLKQELFKKRIFAFYTSITATAVALAGVDDVPDLDAMKQEETDKANSIFAQLARGKTFQKRFRDLFDEFLKEGFFK